LVPNNVGNLLYSLGPILFSGSPVLRGVSYNDASFKSVEKQRLWRCSGSVWTFSTRWDWRTNWYPPGCACAATSREITCPSWHLNDAISCVAVTLRPLHLAGGA